MLTRQALLASHERVSGDISFINIPFQSKAQTKKRSNCRDLSYELRPSPLRLITSVDQVTEVLLLLMAQFNCLPRKPRYVTFDHNLEFRMYALFNFTQVSKFLKVASMQLFSKRLSICKCGKNRAESRAEYSISLNSNLYCN